VQLELELANEVMLAQILRLLRLIIAVVDLHFKALALLEVVVNLNLLDPGGVRCVVDHLCLAKLLPHATRLFVDDGEGVRLGHSVHLGQIFALNAELEALGKATTAEICRRKNCRVDIAT